MGIVGVRRGIGLVAGIAAVALSAGSLSSAHAATKTATMIVMPQLSQVPYGQLQETIQGTLETYSADPTTRQPLGGRSIVIQLKTLWATTTLGTVSTAADGTFTLTAALPTPGQIWAYFAGDTDYAAGNGGTVAKPVTLPTRVTLDPLPATAAGYTSLPASGTVQIQTPDGWTAAPGASVLVLDGTTSRSVRIPTDASGHFSTDVTVTSTGPWTAHSYGDGDSFADNVASDPQTISVTPSPVTITGFWTSYGTPPVPSVAASGGLTFTATVAPYTGTQTADLYFRPRGSSTWTLWGSYPVGWFGKVTISGISGYVSKGHPREGSWQLRTAATPLLQAATSSALTVEVFLQTSFTGVKLMKVGASHYLRGALTSEAVRLAGQKVTLYYRYPGRTYEHKYSTITTGSGGAFSIKLPGKRRYYQLYFAPTGDYGGIYNPERYITW